MQVDTSFLPEEIEIYLWVGINDCIQSVVWSIQNFLCAF